MAIQPSLVQYEWSELRRKTVEVGRLYDDGFLYLEDDPGVWIQSNPHSLSSVRSLKLNLIGYKGERIGDSIGELSQLTHLFIYGRFSNLKCLPNTLSRLHNLHHLELDYCQELEDLPPNFGDLYNLTSLSLVRCHSLKLIGSVAKLSNLTTLFITKLEELPPNLGGLYNLKSLTLHDCENYVIESVTKLSNLTTLIIISTDEGYGELEELPAKLGDLKFLASLFLDCCSRLRCLPWSITKLSNLRFIYLPEEFRIETLPPHLNDSIIISVGHTHIRKTWKELKTQITEFPIITEELAAQKTSTPGYLQFKEDPTLWIRDSNNYGLHSSLRVLDLDLEDWICEGKIPDSIGELPQLTHLYISNGCLPHHLPPTFSRLTHLSLIECTFECHTISHFDSLGNLSTLTSLHLNLKWDEELPKHIDLPISLTHLTLECCYSSIPDSYMASMTKLSNLNTLTLFRCGDLESLPLHLNLTKLILRGTTIKSLPIALKHLEIFHYSYVDESCWTNQLVNLETLSYTCSEIKSLSSLTSLHNLRELQLKDCFSLKELPQDLHKLVNLCTLDVSGTRIQSLPSSIINLYNLQCIILPKCFRLYTLPPDFENKVMISVDDTDESYYKDQGYYNRRYEIINDCDYMTSDSIKEINKKFLEKFKPDATVTVIEQASQHRPSNHQPDATRIIEGSQFNGSTDPTSNNNPNAFISSPNHEIENLPTSNEAGTIPVVVNECYSDVNANTMHVHVPKKFAAFNTGIPNFPYRNNIPAVIMDYLVGLDCDNYVIESVTKLSNLTTLIISGLNQTKELPANLGDLKFLASLFLDFCFKLRYLPWSITKLSNLRILYLPEEFRLETLPPHLNDSIIISVEHTHIRKTWKELKTHVTETLSYQFPIIPEQEEMVALQTSNPEYLHFTGYPTQCDLQSRIQILDLDLWEDGYDEYHTIPDSIGVLQQLTRLYISHGCLLHHLPPSFSRLTHLSLIDCTFECDTDSHFDSLRNLSTLTSLHLQSNAEDLPEHMELPISLRHLSLSDYKSIPDSFVASMATLSNLKSLILSQCGYFKNIVPLNLNFTKLILRKRIIDSIHIGLKHLEIIHWKISCKDKSCSQIEERLNIQFVNLETLSFTCYRIKSLSSVTSLHNLRELQLKDCFNLRELPPDLDKLVNLYTLDVSGTRIHSLPDSIINLHNLQHLILPKCFKPKRFPCDFENKVTISVDDTDESYYKHAGYYKSVYELSDDKDSINSNNTEDVTEIVAGSRQEAIIEQASPHRPLNHPPDEIQILEDPTSNNNPNAFISSPNQEIENLPTLNEYGSDGTIDVDEYLLSEENYAVDENNSPAVSNSQNQETEIWQSNNQDGVVTDKAAEPSSNNLHETNVVGLSNQQVFRNERIANILELEQGTSSSGSLKAQDNNSQRVDVQHKTQKIRDNISLERINELKSQDHLTLEAAAEHLHVSRSTLKRRLKEVGLKWSSSKKKKNPDKNRNETHSTYGRNLSHLNSVDASNPASHDQGVEHLAEPSRPTLSYHVPSKRNVVNNSTPNVVTRTDFEVKASYNGKVVHFKFSRRSNNIEQLKAEVGKRFKLEVDKFQMEYHDEVEWILVTCISDLKRALEFSKSPECNVVRLKITLD